MWESFSIHMAAFRQAERTSRYTARGRVEQPP